MKKLILLTALLFATIGICAQEHPRVEELKSEGYQAFAYEDGDTTFIMKQYYLCIFMRGDKKIEDREKAAQLQQAHLDNIGRLAEEDKICMAGPFADNGEMRGILMFTVPTIEEAEALVQTDPLVQEGALKADIKPIWLAMGSKLN